MIDAPAVRRTAVRPAMLASELQLTLTRLTRRIRVHRSHELKPGHFGVLTLLADLGPMTPGQLANQEHVQPPSMTRTVAALVEAGYVVRQPHATDRRQVVIALSDKGKQEVKETRRRRDEWLARQIAALTQDERETLASASEIMRRLASQ